MNKTIESVVEEYEQAKIVFAKNINQSATSGCNAKNLESAGVVELLKPMLTDRSPRARGYAASAVADLAELDRGISEKIVRGGSLQIMLNNITNYNVHYKELVLRVLGAVTIHEELATAVVELGVVGHLVSSLEDLEPRVKEGAVKALGYIGEHTKELTEQVVAAGALPLMVLAYQEPDISLKQATADAMERLALQQPEAVVEAGAICHLVRTLDHEDSELKRLTLSVLSNIAYDSSKLAEAVVSGGALLPALRHAGHDSPAVRSEVARLLLCIVAHNAQLAQEVVKSRGAALVALKTLASDTEADGAGSTACEALGYISWWSDVLPMTVISCEAVPVLVTLLQNEINEEIKFAAAEALCRIGQHSHKHSRAVAEAKAFPKLLQLYSLPSSSPELREKAREALRLLLAHCDHLPALLSLAHAPQEILDYMPKLSLKTADLLP